MQLMNRMNIAQNSVFKVDEIVKSAALVCNSPFLIFVVFACLVPLLLLLTVVYLNLYQFNS